jgi:hypothetical protein
LRITYINNIMNKKNLINDMSSGRLYIDTFVKPYDTEDFGLKVSDFKWDKKVKSWYVTKKTALFRVKYFMKNMPYIKVKTIIYFNEADYDEDDFYKLDDFYNLDKVIQILKLKKNNQDYYIIEDDN